jgi:hypothetical protein
VLALPQVIATLVLHPLAIVATAVLPLIVAAVQGRGRRCRRGYRQEVVRRTFQAGVGLQGVAALYLQQGVVVVRAPEQRYRRGYRQEVVRRAFRAGVSLQGVAALALLPVEALRFHQVIQVLQHRGERMMVPALS